MVRRWGTRFSALLLLGVALPVWAQLTGDDLGQEEALLEFIKTAEVVNSHQLSPSEGVTEPYRLTLRDGDMERDVLWKNPSGRVKGFWEGWQYEIAAYRLDRYLGVNMVPPTAERRYDANRGSCQLWVTAWLNMRDKAAKKVDPPPEKVSDWNKAVYLQRAFDNLIANDDRHLGNILITEDWRMILIDHSRSFRSSKRHMKKLEFDPEDKPMRKLPRSFVEGVKSLDDAKVRELVGDYLNDKEVEALLARKDLILAEVDRMIQEKGEDKVLY